MTEQEWLTSDDPRAMLDYLNYGGGCPFTEDKGPRIVNYPSDRKLRLFIEACRADYDQCVTPVDWCSIDSIRPYELMGEVRFWCLDNSSPKGWVQQRAHLLREIVGNPFRPVTQKQFDMVEWYGSSLQNVQNLARTIYEDRDFALMPILGDALEEAGCDNEEVLRHCRGEERIIELVGPREWEDGPFTEQPEEVETWRHCLVEHVRGCWVLDLLLGLE